jgi:hypothetical protein
MPSSAMRRARSAGGVRMWTARVESTSRTAGESPRQPATVLQFQWHSQSRSSAPAARAAATAASAAAGSFTSSESSTPAPPIA